MATQQEVYTGFWTNYGHGSVIGATLTLDSANGAYLIAFLALFVHVVGVCFWRLICYVVFQLRAHPNLCNSTKLQEQMILRNSPSSISGLRYLIFLTIRTRPGVRRSTIALLCVAATNLTAFLAAGILSSRITATRPDVLLRPTHCGRWWNFNNASRQYGGSGVYESHIWYTRATSALASLMFASSDYAISCYQSENPPAECTTFGRRPPTWTKALRNGCVFGNDLCDGNITLRIDSGYMDSTMVFGINTPRADRLSLRLTMDCAPIITSDGYFNTYDGTNLSSIFVDKIGGSKESISSFLGSAWEDYSYEAFFYGQGLYMGSHNVTYIWNNNTLTPNFEGIDHTASLYEACYYWCPNTSSSAFSACSSVFYPWSSWDPVAALKIPDHNTVMLFLTWSVWSYKPINDPWFRTNVKYKAFDTTLYGPRQYTKPLACTAKTEICKPHTIGPSQCVQLNPYGWPTVGTDDLPANITKLLGLSARQSAVAHRLQEASWVGDFYTTVHVLGTQRMLAWQQHFGGWLVDLPDDQWAREIEHWFASQLITMQSYTTEYVTGWQDQVVNRFITPPPDAEMWMCESQVIQRRDYASFSVLGIAMILTFGGLVVLLNVSITWMVNRTRPRTPPQMYKKGSWKANDLLELHEAAADGIHRRALSYTIEAKGVQGAPNESGKYPPSVTE